MPTMNEIREKVHAKQDALAELFAKHRDASGQYTHGGEDIAEIRKRSEELDRETKELEGLVAAERDAERFEAAARANEEAIKQRGAYRPGSFDGGGGGDGGPAVDVQRMMQLGFMPQNMPAVKGLGDMLVETKEYKAFKESAGSHRSVSLEIPIHLGEALAVKTTLLGSATLTSYHRPPGVILLGEQMPLVADIIANGTTDAPTIRYQRENSYTNVAVEVGEGLIFPEAAWDLVETDAPVRKIGVTAKESQETIDDFPMAASYVNQRMPFMVAQRLDSQILNGNGTAPNLRGILQTAGIQTQAKGTDPGPDAVYKAMVKVRAVGFFEPDAVVMNYTDFQNMRLLHTADGLYIFGSPTEAGIERIFGKPIVQTAFIAAGTALVGAFQLGAMLFLRRGIAMEMTNANENDFRLNLVCIRAYIRCALVVWRPLGFCSVTGL